MFRFLSRTFPPTTPKLHFLQNHPWLYVKFMSTTSLTSKGNSFTVSYLIDTCGFPPERAASVSKHINFETSEKSDLVIEFFKNHGFSQTQALSMIRKFPQLLRADPEKSLKPKIDFFKSKGFSSSDIPKLMCFPRILCRSLQNEIIPCFDFFNNMFQSKHKLMKAVLRYPGILCDFGKRSALNIKLLREEGVPESHIVRFIEYFPRALKMTPKQFKEAVQEVKELGFDHLKLQFVIAINAKLCIGRSTWATKEGIYRKWGWTDDDISAAFRVRPNCMSISQNKIEAVMDFLVNKLGYASSAIARYPSVLSMSLRKRIIPRGSVILVLLSKGLVNQLHLSAMFNYNEKVFLNKFVYCHEKEADELLKLYQAKLARAGR